MATYHYSGVQVVGTGEVVNIPPIENCHTCRYYKNLIMWPDGKPDYDNPKHCCVAFVYGEEQEHLLCGKEPGDVHEATSDGRCELYEELI